MGMTERAIRWGATAKNKYEFRHVEGIGRGGVQIGNRPGIVAAGSTGQIQQHSKGTYS